MALPIIEQIAAEIATRVGEITVSNGFNQNLTAIRPRRIDYQGSANPGNGTVLIVQEEEEEGDSPKGGFTMFQTFCLIAIVLDSDTASTSIDTRLNQVRADIQKKLLEDNTRGGKAKDTLLLPSVIFDDGEGFSGIAVRVRVLYQVVYGDPYTQI